MSTRHNADYDLIVIGGGASGSNVASGAVEGDLSVALIEEDMLGGTCLNYGCDPTNTMIRSANVMRLARKAERFGIEIDSVRLNWPALQERVHSLIDSIRGGDGIRSTREKGIDLYQDSARFVSENEIIVGEDILTADRFVVATGGTTTIPEIEGIDEVGYLTHRDVASLDELPVSLVIVGGGGIAIEYAQMFLSFGVEVTLVTADERILPREDPDVAEALTVVLEREGLDLYRDTRIRSAQRTPGGTVLMTVAGAEGGLEELEADELLLASGREPRVEGLDLDAAGVAYSAKGIHVDASMRTSVPHIWAVGDVTGIYSYTHVADYQRRVALHNILHPESIRRADYRVVPWKVFTQPEVARVGLTEREARAGGYDVVSSSMPFRDMPRALTMDERDGLVKLVVDRATHRVLGGHVLGTNASEVIAEIALVMQHRLPVSAISDTIHTHPTMSEGVFFVAQNVVNGLLSGTMPVR